MVRMAEEGNAAGRPGDADEPGDATQPFDAVRPDEPADGADKPAPLDETRLDGRPVDAGDAPTEVVAPAAGGWSARAAVRPPGAAGAATEEEWHDEGEPGGERPWLRPVVVALVAVVLLALLGTGVWLILRNSNSGSGPGVTPSASAAPSVSSAAPSASSA